MSGWLLAVPLQEINNLANRLEENRSKYIRSDERVVSINSPHGSILSWRRETHEYRFSGSIYNRLNSNIAWVGQALGDSGDESLGIIDRAHGSIDDVTSALSSSNGGFAIGRLGSSASESWVATCKHAQYPIYVFNGMDIFVASTCLEAIFPWLPERRINAHAASMFLRSGELAGEATLVKGVRQLSPGTLLRVRRWIDTSDPFPERSHGSLGGAPTTRYWRIQHAPDPTVTPDLAADEVGKAMQRAVWRTQKANPDLIVTLSGGLDSRLILALCRNPENIRSYTWGLDGCRDARYARDFAKSVRSPHTARTWDIDAFPNLWSQGVLASGAGSGIQSMFMLPFAKLLAAGGGTVANGLAGDILIGGNATKRTWIRGDRESVSSTLWRWRTSSADDSLADELLVDPFREESVAAWRQSFFDGPFFDGPESAQARVLDWLLDNRVARNTNCGTALIRRELESASPFLDRDVLAVLAKIPFSYRLHHHLYLRVLKKCAPLAAKVRWQRTAIPPNWGYAATLGSMAVHKLNGALHKQFGISLFDGLDVASPEEWIRGSWAPRIGGHLRHPVFLDGGIVRPEAVDRIWRQHLDGQDRTRQIGAMVTISLLAQALQ